MERERSRSGFSIKKRDIVLSTVLAAFISAGVKSGSEAREPYQPEAYPDSAFAPLIIDDNYRRERSSVMTSNNIEVGFPFLSEISSPDSTHKPTEKPNPSVKVSRSKWKLDPEISWYGPGFYGNRTACGLELTKDLIGVAHRSLPCGTLVTFEWEGVEVNAPVVDRGPYVAGRIFDLTGGACMAFKTKEHPKSHCFTGPINYRIEK